MIELVISAGLVGVLAMFIANLATQQNKILTHAEAKSQELEIYNQIRIVLLGKEACEETLRGAALGSSITEIKNSAGSALFNVGEVYGNNNLELVGLEILNDTVPLGGGLGEAILRINTNRVKQRAGIKFMTHDLMLRVTSDSGNNITECFSDDSGIIQTAKHEMCESMGGIFDISTHDCDIAGPMCESIGGIWGENLECQLFIKGGQCEVGEVLTGISPLGEPVCNNPADPVAALCPSTTSLTVDKRCGRINMNAHCRNACLGLGKNCSNGKRISNEGGRPCRIQCSCK